MAVEFGSRATPTRTARSDSFEKASSECRGTRWIAPTGKSRARSQDVDGRGGDIIRTADGVSIGNGGNRSDHGIAIGSGRYEDIGTR